MLSPCQRPCALQCQENYEERRMTASNLTHLQRLEAESIHIMREVVAEAEKPVMLYSVGKDSAVMLHLAKKAFYPSPPPFPLLHLDTRSEEHTSELQSLMRLPYAASCLKKQT